VVGAKIASRANFYYSPALKTKAGYWNDDALYQFLMSPAKFAPGTKMTFAGYENSQDIADILAFMDSWGDARPVLTPAMARPASPRLPTLAQPASAPAGSIQCVLPGGEELRVTRADCHGRGGVVFD